MVLGAYLAMLPAALAFHTAHHHSFDSFYDEYHHQYDDGDIAEGEDCDICTFYFDQQLYVETLLEVRFLTAPFYQNVVLNSSFHRLLPIQLHLRGPPLFDYRESLL